MKTFYVIDREGSDKTLKLRIWYVGILVKKAFLFLYPPYPPSPPPHPGLVSVHW